MQAAVPVGVGAMCALLGADLAKAQALADAAAEGEVCTVANDNDPTQVVLSGHKAAIERAVAMVKDFEIKRGVLLPVSAPFHCPLMQPAADAMAEALGKTPAGRADRAGLRQRHRRHRQRPRRGRSACWSNRSPAASAGAKA
jgi:[acyl-carrier-protein] S-malonyltransferase